MLTRSIHAAPMKSEMKPNIQTSATMPFAVKSALEILRSQKIIVNTRKSITKLSGSTTIHPIGKTQRSHMGKITLYNFISFVFFNILFLPELLFIFYTLEVSDCFNENKLLSLDCLCFFIPYWTYSCGVIAFSISSAVS